MQPNSAAIGVTAAVLHFVAYIAFTVWGGTPLPEALLSGGPAAVGSTVLGGLAAALLAGAELPYRLHC